MLHLAVQFLYQWIWCNYDIWMFWYYRLNPPLAFREVSLMHFSQIFAEFIDAPNEKQVIQTNSSAMCLTFQVWLFSPQTEKQTLTVTDKISVFTVSTHIMSPVGSEFYVIKAGSATVSVSQDWWRVKVPTVKISTSFVPSKSIQVTYAPWISGYGTCMSCIDTFGLW